jgi:hypothetical protein
MRGTNGPMDVITRAEFDDAMKDMLTRGDLQAALAGTNAEIGSIKNKLDDVKVDLLDSIETKIRQTKSSLAFQSVTKSELDDAKVEILATARRNIAEAIAPLATKADLDGVKFEIVGVKSDIVGLKSEVEGVKSEVEQGFLKMASRLDTMEHKINTVVIDGYRSLEGLMTGFIAEMRSTVKHHEERLDRHDADLYKLRQSGVLQ